MEDVTAYIESGILELYVLGQLADTENQQVEAMAAKYPLIKKEILAIENALEDYAQTNAIAPSADLGDRIFAELINAPEETEPRPKIIPLSVGSKSNNTSLLKWGLAACVALLVFCATAIYSLDRKLDAAQEQIASLSIEKDRFLRTVTQLKFDKDGMENRIAMTESSEWRTVKLEGVKQSPNARMLVYWNKSNKHILINYAAIDLPATDETHEYQLWALVDNKPVSLGVFASRAHATSAILEMEHIQQAQAFAVTIEPRGGSVNPTMEKMVVMGAI